MKHNIRFFDSYAISISAVVVLSIACGDKTAVPGTAATVAGGGTTETPGGAGVGSVTSGAGGSIGSVTAPQAGSGAATSAGAAGKGSVVACTGQGKALQDGTCKKTASGVYALRLDIPVYWGERSLAGLLPVVDAGRGNFRYFAKLEVGNVCEDGKFDAKMYTCGIRLPTFYSSLLCEGYETEMPDSAWDKKDIAPFAVKGAYNGFGPGNSMSLNTMDYIFGIDLKDPTGKWPTPEETLSFACTSGTGKACFPDYDRDGKPGITLLPKGEGGNVLDKGCIDALGGNNPFKRNFPPLSADITALLGGAARAGELYIAFRIKAGGGGTMESDCVTAKGEVPGEYLNSRAAGCIVKEGTQDLLGNPAGPNTACADAQANFLDTQFPDFQPLNKGEKPPTDSKVKDTSVSVGTLTSTIRLGDSNQSFSCTDVRNARFK